MSNSADCASLIASFDFAGLGRDAVASLPRHVGDHHPDHDSSSTRNTEPAGGRVAVMMMLSLPRPHTLGCNKRQPAQPSSELIPIAADRPAAPSRPSGRERLSAVDQRVLPGAIAGTPIGQQPIP